MSEAFPPLGSRREGAGQARRSRIPNPYRPASERDFDPYPSRLTELRRRAVEQAYAAEDALLEQGRTLSGTNPQRHASRPEDGVDGVAFLSPAVAPALRSWGLDGLDSEMEERDEEPTADRPQVYGMSRVIINTPGQAKKKARRKRKSGASTPARSEEAQVRATSQTLDTPPSSTRMLDRLEDHARTLHSRPIPWDNHLWQPDFATQASEADVVLEPAAAVQGLDVGLSQSLKQIRRIRATRSALSRAAHNQRPGTSDSYAAEVEAERKTWNTVQKLLDGLLSSPEALVRRFSPIRLFHNHVLHGLVGVDGAKPALDDAREAEANRFAEWFADLSRPYSASLAAEPSDAHILQDAPGDKVLVDQIHDRLVSLLEQLSDSSSPSSPPKQNLNLVALLLVRSVFAPLFSSKDDLSLWMPYLAAFAFHTTASSLLWLHLSAAGPAYALAKTNLVFHDLHSHMDAALLLLMQQGPGCSEPHVRERFLASRIGLHNFYLASRSCLYAPAAAQGAYAYRFGSDVLDEHASLVVRSFLSLNRSPGSWPHYLFGSALLDGMPFSFALKRRLVASAILVRFAGAADTVVWEEMASTSFRLGRAAPSRPVDDDESWADRGSDAVHPENPDDPLTTVGVRIVGTSGLERALAELGLRDGHGPLRRLEIGVRRSQLVEDSLDLLAYLSRAMPDARQLPVSVHWVGEEAVDGGGPRREWISALVAALLPPRGAEGSTVSLGAWLGSLDRQRAWLLGCALGLALLHDVPLRPDLPLWFYRCLLGLGEVPGAQWCLSDVEQECDADLAGRMVAYTDAVGALEPARTAPSEDVRRISDTRRDRLRETQDHIASALLGPHEADEGRIMGHLTKIREGFQWMTYAIPVYNFLGPNELRAILCGWDSVGDPQEAGQGREADQGRADELLVRHLRRATRHIGFTGGPPTDLQLQDHFWSLFLSDWTASQRSALLSFVTGAPGLPSGWHRAAPAPASGQAETSTGSTAPEGAAVAMTLHLVDDPAFASYVPWSSTCTSTLFLPRMAAHELGPRLQVALQNATAGFGLK